MSSVPQRGHGRALDAIVRESASAGTAAPQLPQRSAVTKASPQTWISTGAAPDPQARSTIRASGNAAASCGNGRTDQVS